MTIGILDSGVGGLGIALEIRRRMQWENIVYLGDNAWCPYGTKEKEPLNRRIHKALQILVDNGCKIGVLACNTATVSSLSSLRSAFSLPIVGVVPVIKVAAKMTVKKKIGVLATNITLGSEYFSSLIDQFAWDCQVFGNYENGLVEAIEFGPWDDEKLEILLKKAIEPLKDKGVDVLALGCTHFTLIKGKIQDIAGPGIMVLDSNDAVANQVKRVLDSNNAMANQGKKVLDSNNRQLDALKGVGSFKCLITGTDKWFQMAINSLFSGHPNISLAKIQISEDN